MIELIGVPFDLTGIGTSARFDIIRLQGLVLRSRPSTERIILLTV